LSEGSIDLIDFIELYSPLSQPLHLIFYFLTVICTVSILDRYDIAQFNWRQLQKLLTFRSGGFAIIIYTFTLVITLVTTKMDDKLSLYQHNSTIFDLTDPQVFHFIFTGRYIFCLYRCRIHFLSLYRGTLLVCTAPDNIFCLYRGRGVVVT
jgi:hypothetical protein